MAKSISLPNCNRYLLKLACPQHLNRGWASDDLSRQAGEKFIWICNRSASESGQYITDHQTRFSRRAVWFNPYQQQASCLLATKRLLLVLRDFYRLAAYSQVTPAHRAVFDQ
jgi:hypothetical protein